MKESIYKDYGKLLLFLNAATVARVLGVSPFSGYELMHVVVTNSVSLAPPQAAGLAHFVAISPPQFITNHAFPSPVNCVA